MKRQRETGEQEANIKEVARTEERGNQVTQRPRVTSDRVRLELRGKKEQHDQTLSEDGVNQSA